MQNSILLPINFLYFDFQKLAKNEPNPANRLRLIAMANIQQGKTLKSIAQILQVHWKTVQKWISNFRKKGLDGLFTQSKPGAPRKLTSEVDKWISDFMNALNSSINGGQITGRQLHALVEKEFEITCSLRTIYTTLHRLKFSWITARSVHPKSDLEVQELYKKLSRFSSKTNSE
tara:strand:- start:554 stop:1075 length:522 start_codon:yes stop_codon:yes gene_type:complete